MLDPENISPVEENELLARYVMQSSLFRSDRTVKPNLFIPHPYQELSVTRHRDATEAEIWQAGVNVATQQQRTLHGRSDILTKNCLVESLRVTAQPFPDNPNHADIEGWPMAKEDQKAIALKLAAAATKLIPPSSTLA
ncbi:hypothetical protein L3556_03960 [Candidatus Synechococcus calcipolaris G9]|uniref:Uncharacterized protein n=1 Tax=Candidatus Synechococcus calcipolaris G9 TaxID=1497997 RepID=A0ABT6EWD3_9SYNE|nr:hypothetical protein [Candidatus Synechococcus calcipolaris]MDG2990092.1 hypothetical protein [Candidatus Synechococcus calcipolaris G9]